MFTLTIDTGNAAFAEDRTGEVGRILEALASRLFNLPEQGDDDGAVTDINGNTVGRWAVTGEMRAGAWVEPDVSTLDELTRWATFGADRVAIDMLARGDLTGADRTRETVRAGIRLLLANRLVLPTLPPDGAGVMITLDPPVAEVQA